MTVFFTIGDIIDQMDKSKSKDKSGWDQLIPVDDSIPACGGYPEDAFILSSKPRILDLDTDDSTHDLAVLLEKVPLYRLNMELALDDALTEQPRNAVLDKALKTAFAEREPPELPGAEEGNLRHPALGDMSDQQLAATYAKFIRIIGPERSAFGFERAILGHQKARFTEHFDGYLHNGRGRIKASLLLGFGARRDHESVRASENPAQHGERLARKMKISDIKELLWAWLEADDFQMRRTRDLHRLLSIPDLPRLPHWARTDLALLQEKEAMKKVFAAQIKKIDPSFSCAKDAPALLKALTDSAAAITDPLLPPVIARASATAGAYNGEADKFSRQAAQRMKEVKKKGVI